MSTVLVTVDADANSVQLPTLTRAITRTHNRVRSQLNNWKVNVDNLGVDFLSELVGTAMLVLLGTGVVANVALIKTKGFNGGFLMVNIGWGLAVFAGVVVAYNSGAHLNPAVTLGLVANGAKTFGSRRRTRSYR